MIIKGKSRAGPVALAAHLGNAEKNERVTLLEVKGTVAQDLRGALVEMDAYAIGTHCEKPLYHLAMSPGPPHRLTPEQRNEAIEAVEDKLGLTGHARVVVLHEKLGREHIHIAWSRIDLDRMVSVSDSHNYRKHEEVARDLERRFGHERVQGAHHEREGVARPDRTPSRAELRQEERTGITAKQVKEEVTAAFRASDGPEAFKAALADQGYILAKGDRRDFVVLDHAGGIHSLARRIDGMKAAELREYMAPLNREDFPDIAQAKEIIDERKRQAHEAHTDASIEKAYGRGGDYVSQTTAAQKDYRLRQGELDEINERPRPLRPDEISQPALDTGPDANEPDERDDDQKRIDKIIEDNRKKTGDDIVRPASKQDSGKFDNVEITDRMSHLIDRYVEAANEIEGTDHEHDAGPDRQREAPGGGRTRSR